MQVIRLFYVPNNDRKKWKKISLLPIASNLPINRNIIIVYEHFKKMKKMRNIKKMEKQKREFMKSKTMKYFFVCKDPSEA